MKLSVFNNYVLERIRLLQINTVNSYRIDMAYFAQGWTSLLSTTTYTLSYFLLLHIVYSNISEFASYTRNDVLFVTLIAQLSFYIMGTCQFANIRNLILDVNRGNIDLILTKPLPSLFYMMTRNIGVVGFMRDGMPTLILIALAINWNYIHVAALHFLIGIIVFICGQLVINTYLFIFALPVFWQGEANELFGLAIEPMGVPTQIPYEGLQYWLKYIFTTIIPVVISTTLTASVMLGKSNAWLTLVFSIGIAVLAVYLKIYLWKFALRSYTSASS